MICSRRQHLGMLSVALGGACRYGWAAEVDFSSYTDEQKEKILRTGKVVSVKEIGHGVTKPRRAELSLGDVRHAAQIQVVDKELPDFFGPDGQRVSMRDCWKYNIAAYRIDRLLNMNMSPAVVARTFQGKPAAFSWWVDNVLCEEVDRVKKNLQPPDPESFERQRAIGQVFDELIINIDRNLSNTLITNDWKIALIDHSRSFTAYSGIRNKENLKRCSRNLLSKMSAMSSASVEKAVGNMLTAAEIQALLGRRDKIVEFFQTEAKAKGEDTVLFS